MAQEILNAVGRNYFTLGLLAFYLWFAGFGLKTWQAHRRAKVVQRRAETRATRREVKQYLTYRAYVADLETQERRNAECLRLERQRAERQSAERKAAESAPLRRAA